MRSMDVERIAAIENFQKIFEFHYFNFLSNVEHMRCSIHAFLNKDTMKMLAAIAGQYNVLERHKKRHGDLAEKRKDFASLIDALWHKNHAIADHMGMLTYLQTSKSKKVKEMIMLFGRNATKDIVVNVLHKYDAVRGMPGFKTRKSDN